MSKPVQFQEGPESPGFPYGPYRAVIERVVWTATPSTSASL